MIPMQRFVYVLAKDHHEEDVDADKKPSGMNKAHGVTKY